MEERGKKRAWRTKITPQAQILIWTDLVRAPKSVKIFALAAAAETSGDFPFRAAANWPTGLFSLSFPPLLPLLASHCRWCLQSQLPGSALTLYFNDFDIQLKVVDGIEADVEDSFMVPRSFRDGGPLILFFNLTRPLLSSLPSERKLNGVRTAAEDLKIKKNSKHACHVRPSP